MKTRFWPKFTSFFVCTCMCWCVRVTTPLLSALAKNLCSKSIRNMDICRHGYQAKTCIPLSGYFPLHQFFFSFLFLFLLFCCLLFFLIFFFPVCFNFLAYLLLKIQSRCSKKAKRTCLFASWLRSSSFAAFVFHLIACSVQRAAGPVNMDSFERGMQPTQFTYLPIYPRLAYMYDIFYQQRQRDKNEGDGLPVQLRGCLRGMMFMRELINLFSKHNLEYMD